MVKPNWEERDLPVLHAIVDLFEENGGSEIDPGSIGQVTGFDDETVQRALRALRDSEQPFFTDSYTVPEDGTVMVIGAPTGWARRAVGLWPTPEILADRIIVALDKAADAEADEGKRRKSKELARWAAESARDFLVQVAATAVTGQPPGTAGG